jgi:ABC-type transport system involved in multi-copper enzyme maturation permease subunit
MKNILSRTLEQTLKPITVIMAVLCGMVGGVIISQAYTEGTNTAFVSLANNMVITQSIVVFFLSAGIFLMCVVIGSVTGLVASEVHDGTLRLLVAKPESRTKILGAKILGSSLGSYLAYLVVLAVMAVTFILSGHCDGNILNIMLGYYPAYMLYGLILVIIMTSISVLLSVICRRKVTAMIPLLVVMILILGFFPISRSIGALGVSSVDSANSLKYLYDLNYHFASIFNWCLNLHGGITGTTDQLQVVSLLMNTFSAVNIDPDFLGVGEYSNTYYLPNLQLLPWAVTLVYLAISGGCLAGSFAIFKKKDI